MQVFDFTLVLDATFRANAQRDNGLNFINHIKNQAVAANLNAQRLSAKSGKSHPFASTYRAFRANAQREKLVSQVVHSVVDFPTLPPFSRFSRLPRFLPIPFPAHSPSLRVFANGGAASALRLSPPNSPLRARLLPLPFVDAVLSPSPTTKQLSERERGGGREDA